MLESLWPKGTGCVSSAPAFGEEGLRHQVRERVEWRRCAGRVRKAVSSRDPLLKARFQSLADWM